MKRALLTACLAVALTGGAAPVLAQPKAPAKKPADAKPPAKPANKPPPRKEEDDNTVYIIVGVIGGLVILGGGGLIVYKLVSSSGSGGGGDGRPPEPILPQRKHDWELRMSEPQEAAMLRGIQAWRDSGHSLYLSHDDALITHYEPTMLVSLHRVTDAFLAAGHAAEQDATGTMRATFEAFAAAEGPGVLHTRKTWYMPAIDGLDHQAFTDLCYDTLTNPDPYVEGSQGSSADENNGHLTVKIAHGGPLNTFCVDLGRVLPLVQQARTGRPTGPLVELVRPVLRAMVRGEIPGGMWTRGGATPAEIDLVCRMIAAGKPRQR